MLELKFILVSGTVLSKDLDRHFISSNKLIELYQLPVDQCVCVDEEIPERSYKNKDLINPYQIILYPRDFGDYEEHLRDLFNLWSSVYGA